MSNFEGKRGAGAILFDPVLSTARDDSQGKYVVTTIDISRLKVVEYIWSLEGHV